MLGWPDEPGREPEQCPRHHPLRLPVPPHGAEQSGHSPTYSTVYTCLTDPDYWWRGGGWGSSNLDLEIELNPDPNQNCLSFTYRPIYIGC